MAQALFPTRRDVQRGAGGSLTELAPPGVNIPNHGAFWRVAAVYLRRSEDDPSEDARRSYANLAARCRQLAQAEDAAELAAAGLNPTQLVSNEDVEEPCADPGTAAEAIMREALRSS